MKSELLADLRLIRAIQTAREFGLRVSIGSPVIKNHPVSDVAEALGTNKRWVMEHLDEFPRRFRLAGVGEWRIPIADLEAALDRWAKHSANGGNGE
jgi:hypothetical protein